MLYKCKTCGNNNLLADEMCRGIGSLGQCKKCYSAYHREYRKTHPYRREKVQWRNTNLKMLYGITEDKYNEMLELHLHGCAICKQPCKTGDKLSVDHNHKTKKVRGLLCKKCNAAIALLNEDEDLFINAIEYLKRTTWGVRKAG